MWARGHDGRLVSAPRSRPAPCAGAWCRRGRARRGACRALVVAGPHAGPGGEAVGGAEHGHRVRPGLGEDGRRRGGVDAGNGLQQVQQVRQHRPVDGAQLRGRSSLPRTWLLSLPRMASLPSPSTRPSRMRRPFMPKMSVTATVAHPAAFRNQRAPVPAQHAQFARRREAPPAGLLWLTRLRQLNRFTRVSR